MVSPCNPGHSKTYTVDQTDREIIDIFLPLPPWVFRLKTGLTTPSYLFFYCAFSGFLLLFTTDYLSVEFTFSDIVKVNHVHNVTHQSCVFLPLSMWLSKLPMFLSVLKGISKTSTQGWNSWPRQSPTNLHITQMCVWFSSVYVWISTSMYAHHAHA